MSYDYGALAARAKVIIDRFGRPMTLRRPQPFAGSAFQPVPVAPVDTVVVGVVTENSIKDTSGETVTFRTVRKVLLASSAAPQKDDLIIFDNRDHEIEEVITHAPGGTAVIYECRIAS